MIEGASSRYEPGQRRWIKHKTRKSTEVIIGAVTGRITAPESNAGLHRGGELRIVGRSVPLKPAQSRSLAAVLTPAGKDHPWPDSIIANRFAADRDRTSLTKVKPLIAAEVTPQTPAYTAGSGGTHCVLSDTDPTSPQETLTMDAMETGGTD